jgi:hypothetical protein
MDLTPVSLEPALLVSRLAALVNRLAMAPWAVNGGVRPARDKASMATHWPPASSAFEAPLPLDLLEV